MNTRAIASDHPLVEPDVILTAFNRLQLLPEEREAIVHRNARRLIGL